MILDNLISLLGAFFTSGIATYAIYPVALVAFIATVPPIVRQFWR